MRDADVAVVGAGLAGLTAATELTSDGYDVAVLEARDRVGGRTFDQTVVGGTPVELGGQWIGPTQDAIASVIESCGLETHPTHVDGDDVTVYDGETVRHFEEELGLPEDTTIEVFRIWEDIMRSSPSRRRWPVGSPTTRPSRPGGTA